MPKYFCILANEMMEPDWKHPTQLFARNKAEAKSFLLENVSAETISTILTEQEYAQKMGYNIPNAVTEVSANINNVDNENLTGNEAFNNIFQEAMSMGEEQNNVPIVQQVVQHTQVDLPVNKQTNVSATEIKKEEPKYFSDGINEFKVEDGKLFKKDWNDESENKNFRLINKKTGKQIELADKYIIQQLTWKEL